MDVHLGEGGTLTPEWYAADLSKQSHGVFAVEASDGTYTLTAVAWDSVAKISVRRVSDLPRDLFR